MYLILLHSTKFVDLFGTLDLLLPIVRLKSICRHFVTFEADSIQSHSSLLFYVYQQLTWLTLTYFGLMISLVSMFSVWPSG